MLFNSYSFLLAFLPLSLALFYTFNRRNHQAGKLVLLLLSLIFISSSGIYHGLIAIGSTLVNYCINRRISTVTSGKKGLLTVGILFNIGLLCFFKYAPSLGLSIAFPMGLSFYSFQQIAFLADSYHQADHVSLTDYSLFVLFFPKAVQGPIPYGSELLPRLHRPAADGFRFERFSGALYLFAMVPCVPG